MQINFQTQNLSLSPAQAAQHLLNRRRARNNIVDYAAYIDVPGRPISDKEDCELFEPVETNLSAHHKLILTTAHRTSITRYGRSMLLFPPGAGKSSYASVVFPSKYLGDGAGRRLILGSYGADLAKKMGRRTRSIIKQQRYEKLLDVRLSNESSAADQFTLSNGSEYMAAGLLSGITGNRAHGVIIDDPIKGREDANSEVIRNKTWEAYQDDLLTRLIPGGWVMMILTRWSEDDPAGRILPENWRGESGMIKCRDGMTWNVVCVQAKCETHTDPLSRKFGEYLWPEWYDAQHWSQFEQFPSTWTSLFQQVPRPIEGAYFLQESFLVDGQPVPMPNKIDIIYAIIDTAIKTGREHDGTGVVFFALCRTGITHPLHIVDWGYQQIQGASLESWLPSVFDRLEELCVITQARMGSVGAFIEDKASGSVLLQQVSNHNDRIGMGQSDAPMWPAQAIESKLSSMGKSERAFDASEYVSSGQVKITQEAYEKVVTFKGSTKNHLMSQVLQFQMDAKDTAADDLLDCLTYGCALGLGGRGGF